jgi:hypothetical protein
MNCETCSAPTCESCGGCKCPGNECLCEDIFGDNDDPAAEKTLEDVEI